MSLTEPFQAEFMQRAFLEACIVAVLGGVLGTWIVLRSLAFYAHAVGTATFPGLVLADAWALPAQPVALATALVTALAIQAVGSARPRSPDVATALVLVAALAAGVVLASDVYEAGAGVDRLLFGSLLAVSAGDIWISLAVAVVAAAVVLGARRAWLAAGFDRDSVGSLGLGAPLYDALLMGVIALAVVAVLDAVGALLVGALFVLPAAAARLLSTSVRGMHGLAVLFALGEAVAGLWIAYHLDVPPGPAIATLGGAVLLAAAGAARLRAPALGAAA